MLLSDLDWDHRTFVDAAQIPGTGRWIYRAKEGYSDRAGTYCITESSSGFFFVYEWKHVDELTAQCVLFYLTGERDVTG